MPTPHPQLYIVAYKGTNRPNKVYVISIKYVLGHSRITKNP